MPAEISHYESVSPSEDYGRSSTEVEDALMDDEKRWHSTATELDAGTRRNPRTGWNRTKAALRKYRWLIDTLLLLTNILLSLGLSLLMYFQFEEARFSSSTKQVGGDYTAAGPIFPTKIVEFAADFAYVPPSATNFLSNETLSSWRSLLPGRAGWGAVTEYPFFTTSMTHQLHCIFMMGRIYSLLMTNAANKLPDDHASHYFHCVDYLRQGVMCSGDMAMEPHSDTDADDNGPGDGSWNGQHVCKDYGQMIKYLDKQISESVRVVLPIDD